MRKIISTFIISLLLLGCTQTVDPQTVAAEQAEAENYIRDHINELSPEPPVLGGTFYVVHFQWQEDFKTLVTYEDGHIQLQAIATILPDENGVIIETFNSLAP